MAFNLHKIPEIFADTFSHYYKHADQQTVHCINHATTCLLICKLTITTGRNFGHLEILFDISSTHIHRLTSSRNYGANRMAVSFSKYDTAKVKTSNTHAP